MGRLTWTVGRTQLVRTRKELDPRPLPIGGMDLAIKGRSEDLWQDRTRWKNRYGTICATESHFCKKKVVWAQACGEGRKLHGMGVVDWIGLDSEQDWTDTGPSLDLR